MNGFPGTPLRQLQGLHRGGCRRVPLMKIVGNPAMSAFSLACNSRPDIPCMRISESGIVWCVDRIWEFLR